MQFVHDNLYISLAVCTILKWIVYFGKYCCGTPEIRAYCRQVDFHEVQTTASKTSRVKSNKLFAYETILETKEKRTLVRDIHKMSMSCRISPEVGTIHHFFPIFSLLLKKIEKMRLGSTSQLTHFLAVLGLPRVLIVFRVVDKFRLEFKWTQRHLCLRHCGL
jgi:hypothetical protein